MKPLYLNGKPCMTVALDGPALEVAAPGRAASLYPLQRISRIISSGAVTWSTEALLACAERGITVTFLHRDGTIRAYLFGESNLREGLLSRLRDLLDRPDWQERYRDWYRAMESRARRALVKRLGTSAEAVPLSRLEAGIAELKHRYIGPGVCRFLERRLQGLLGGLVAQLLMEAGLSAERIRCLGGRIHLAEDIARLLAWDLHLPILEWLQQRYRLQGATARIDDAELVRLFENRSDRLHRLGHSIMNRLHGYLVDVAA